MPRLALTGGAYQARSVIASAQRCLNLYVEPLPQQQGDPSLFAHYPTPGLRLLGTLPKGPVRGIRQATTGGIYTVGGDTVYLLDPIAWTATPLGTITGLRPYPVSMSDNGNTMVIVDGTVGGWTVDLASNAFAALNDPAFYGADRVDYLDTYFLFNKPSTPQFYSSDSLATTFDSLYFANKESFSDLLVTLAVAKREIWLLGDRTTEVWYDAGASDFPFQQVQGVFVDHGCAAKYSIATYDNAIYWLSRDRSGQGYVLEGAGYQTKRVSTFAIEDAMVSYPRIDDAIGFVYMLAGHVCYVLTFPAADATWVFDITSGQWHEWLWTDANGDEHRHRANCAYPCFGTVVVGDWQNGNLYALDANVFTDNGAPIKRQRSFPHMIANGNRVFYRQFLADIETGNSPIATPVTITQKIITWPPQIAQLGALTASYVATRVAPDWQRGVLYIMDGSYYSTYAIDLTTQLTPTLLVPADALYSRLLALDPLSGDVLTQRGTTNGEPVIKRDPTTFAPIASFGTITNTPTYPTAVSFGEVLVCVVCSGVSYGLIKDGNVGSGNVSAFRVDTMQHAGFHQAIIAGHPYTQGIGCAGASGGSTATAFFTWANAQYSTTLPLYVVTITAAANSYNPATWPATNPGISWHQAGTIVVADIDPTLPNMACYSIGYDHADGNVLMWISTATTNVAINAFIVKVRATDAAVLWVLPIDIATRISLGNSRINGSLWVWGCDVGGGVHTSWQIDTILGTATTQRLGGVFNNIPGYPMFDSDSQLTIYWGSYAAGSRSPVAVPGTGNFNNTNWAIMGGQTLNTIVTGAVGDITNRIWLDWSDDRGHSYGDPVVQSFGQRGRYLTSLQWQRLGFARDRVFRLTWSEPVHTALQGAWIDLDANTKT